MERPSRNLAFHIAETNEEPEYRRRRFSIFVELDAIKRFAYEPMIHRSTVLAHTNRVTSMALVMTSYLSKTHAIELSGLTVNRLAHYHDYPEAYTGDIPSPDKEKLTPDKKTELEQDEHNAIDEIASYLMPEFKETFMRDLKTIKEKKTPEAQLVKIADVIDGFCEVITDIRCGNDTPEIDTVYGEYLKKLKNLRHFPLMKYLQDSPTFGLESIPSLDEVRSLSKIDLSLLSQQDNGSAFWHRVFDPTLPKVYYNWLQWSANSNSYDLGILTGWKDTLRGYPLSPEIRFQSKQQPPNPSNQLSKL